MNKERGTAIQMNDTILMVYTGEHYGKVKPLEDITKLLKNGVCNKEVTKNLVKKGKVFEYIYVHENKISVIKIDSCE